MKKIMFIISFIFFIILFTGYAFAFRCGDALVSVGDSKVKVLQECGQPSHKEKVGSKKTRRYKKGEYHSRERHTSQQRSFKEVTKPVEKWYYNCGSNDFIYVLTFEGGILKNEETGGYGKGESQCRGK